MEDYKMEGGGLEQTEKCRKETAEGFLSLEEHVQEYMEIFLLLQQEETEETRDWFWKKAALLIEREQATELFLPARYLRECCALTETEYFIVMFAFCCELEEGLCLDFRNKCHERWPNLQYVLHLLSQVLSVDFAVVAELCGAKSPLGDILILIPEGKIEESGREEYGPLLQPLLLNHMAFDFLLTGKLSKGSWYDFFAPGELGKPLADQKYFPLHERECDMLCRYLDMESPLRILLHGDRGTGKHTLLRRVCRKKQCNAVFVKLPRLWEKTEQFQDRFRQTLRLVCRLLNPVVVLELWKGLPGEALTEEKCMSHLEVLLSEELSDRNLILLTEGQLESQLAGRLADVQMELREVLSDEEKKLALNVWLAPGERREWQEELLGRYRLNMGELKRKWKTVCLQTEVEQSSFLNPGAWELGLQERNGISRLGKLIESRAAPEDLILPEDCRRQLEMVFRLAKGWKGAQGIRLLFHGSSGTGKTMAASVLARQLKLLLFKVDLSQIYDKYIGETEKHMDEIFWTAQRNHYMLFFDEADALFAKRTNIGDSHDKYANVSTSYLLQRIEDYEGILVLATNLINHFDNAFVRRIHFVVKFHDLDENGRSLLWEKALAGTPSVAQDVSFGELARAAQLSPARIKCAAQLARQLAVCEEGGTVTRKLLQEALEMEAGKDETAVKGI